MSRSEVALHQNVPHSSEQYERLYAAHAIFSCVTTEVSRTRRTGGRTDDAARHRLAKIRGHIDVYTYKTAIARSDRLRVSTDAALEPRSSSQHAANNVCPQRHDYFTEFARLWPPRSTIVRDSADDSRDPIGVEREGFDRKDGGTELLSSEIGRFVLLRKIGSGGMGVVYVAYDPELDRRVAVKLLHPDVSGSQREGNAKARLLREAKVLARVSHPNVVAVYDVGTHHGRVFLAMEFIRGMPLSEWLRDHKRAPATIVERFIAAGRGLAAAHREGLVHGDFKPDNVLVDTDGRVRVVDFGLASASEQPETERDGSTDDRQLPSTALTSSELSTRLTRSGEFAGTPAYLAPEQFRGAHRSPKSDQFSFCVSLFEGLYGERPFNGNSVKELLRAVLKGPPPEPAESVVPAWLRKVVIRGLNIDPELRYPDMDALLSALGNDPSRRRRRITAIAALAFLLATAAIVYRWALIRELETRQGLCTGASDELVGVWGPQRKQAVQQAFQKTGLPYASDVSERVSTRLDERADAWVTMRTDACQATHLRGEQSSSLLDLRMACLQRRLLEMRLLTDVLVDADTAVVEHAAQAVEQLASLDMCADKAGLLSEKQTRTDAEAATFEVIQGTLAQAKAYEITNRIEIGLKLAATAIDQAQALGERPLVAESLFVRGELLEALGDPEAVESLREAFFTAEATRDDLLPVKVAIALMQHAVVRIDIKRGHEWSLHARALLDRMGDAYPTRSRELEADYESVRGSLHTHEGQFDAAKIAFHRALELRGDPSESHLAAIYNNLGNLLVRTGELEEAKVELERSAGLYRKFLGPRHPRVGIALNNLGELMIRQGHFERAQQTDREALEILVAALGPSHPNVGVVVNNLGFIAVELGDFAEAIAQFNRARDIFETSFGANAPPVAFPLTGLGEAKLATGDVAAAQALLEQALPLLEGGSPTDRAHTCFVLARALADSERGRARTLAEEARSAYADAGPAYARELKDVVDWLAAHPENGEEDEPVK